MFKEYRLIFQDQDKGAETTKSNGESTEAAGEAAKTATGKPTEAPGARGKVSDDVIGGLADKDKKPAVKPADKPGQTPSQKAGLPQNEWARKYDTLMEVVESDDTPKYNKMLQVIASFLAFMATTGAPLFNLFNAFSPDDLEEGDLGNESLEPDQVQALQSQARRDVNKFNLDDYKDLQGSEASCYFVSGLLFGEEKSLRMTDWKILAARLNNTAVDYSTSLYKDATYSKLKRTENIPKGTVIFFRQRLDGEMITAYATGNKKEFICYIAGSKTSTKFPFGSKDSLCKSEMHLVYAFFPRYYTDPNNTEEVTPNLNALSPIASIHKLAERVGAAKSEIEEAYKKDEKLINPETISGILKTLEDCKDSFDSFLSTIKSLSGHPEIAKFKKILSDQHAIYLKLIQDVHARYTTSVDELQNLTDPEKVLTQLDKILTEAEALIPEKPEVEPEPATGTK
jgi:hypothetical protein